MKPKFSKQDIIKCFSILVGAAIYAIGMNFFIVPCGLYSSGLLGVAQILRTIVERWLDVSFGFDISGIISFILNVPLMIWAYKTVGKSFIVKTALCLAMQSVLLSVIPIREIITDSLTSCIIGGIMCGAGVGLAFRNGGSSGGVDIIGMYYAKKNGTTVGKVGLLINIVVYAAAFAIMQSIEKIIYTLIFAAISMFALDKMHIQNINSEVIIFSKHNDSEIQNALMKEMRRGVSYWEGVGAYTGDKNRILYIVVSEYELPHLKRIVNAIDPKAFIAVKSGIEVCGNFERRL